MSAAELNQLKEEVARLSRKVDTVCSAILDLTARTKDLESGSSSEQAPTRTSGYVNWSSSHDVLKTQRWVKLTTIKKYIGQMESLWNFTTGKDKLEALPTSDDVCAIAENKRFPQDGAYVNIYCPNVSKELTDLHLQMTKPGRDLLKRFDENCSKDIHTFSSFEEFYKLKWV